MNIIDFEGISLIPEKIIGCSEITTISTGNRPCDWEYGFYIYCERMKIPYSISTNYGHVGGISEKEYLDKVNQKREELLYKIKQYKNN